MCGLNSGSLRVRASSAPKCASAAAASSRGLQRHPVVQPRHFRGVTGQCDLDARRLGRGGNADRGGAGAQIGRRGERRDRRRRQHRAVGAAHGQFLTAFGIGLHALKLAQGAVGAANRRARGELQALLCGGGGFLGAAGVLDFAGGLVVHLNAGVAGLIGAYLIGKRVGFGKEAMKPHNLTMTMIGASMLWVGWFGFNAGSALEANNSAALAFLNTFLATACAVLSWTFAEWMFKGKPSMLGAASGAVAGLVAITAPCGFVNPVSSVIIGLIGGVLLGVLIGTASGFYGKAIDIGLMRLRPFAALRAFQRSSWV